MSGVDQSVLSRHLAQLRAVGVITERRDGARVIFHLACPCILDALRCASGVLIEEVKRKRRVAGLK